MSTHTKHAYILGLNISHNATACLMKDDQIVSCVSEERFNRIKNYDGFPKLAVEYLLHKENITANDLALIVGGGKSLTPSWDPINYKGLEKNIHMGLYTLASYSQKLDYLMRFVYKSITKTTSKLKSEKIILDSLNISNKKVILADHHSCHAYAAYFGFVSRKDKLNKSAVITLDGEGDLLCSSVWNAKGTNLRLICATAAGNSPAAIYADVTRILGMKINEHEYKVMGLAPYAKAEYSKGSYEVLKSLVTFDKKSLTFKSKFGQRASFVYLKRKLADYRFDAIAYAVQQWTEELMVEFAEASLKKLQTKILVVGGGWYMNVKGNMEITKSKLLKNLIVCPSGGDESLAIGACYFGFKKLNPTGYPSEISSLYLGPEYESREISQVISKFKKESRFSLKKFEDINTQIVKLLIKGKAVARFSGRMEWGARALGNRSILADPRNVEIKKVINEQIKNRDFWMPFAPSLLSEGIKKYLINPKNIASEHMVLAFETTPLGKKDLAAAIHPYDNTARPQIVSKEANIEYYELIKLFEKKTGVSAILNTSFNLHGEPIVCSPQDAMNTFVNSGLEYLAIENYLLSKIV